MKNAKPIDLLKINEWDIELQNDKNQKVATNALYLNKINSVAVVGDSRKNKISQFSNDYQIPTSVITDQKQSGRCWMFATLNMLRHNFMKINGIDNFEFSQSYCVFWEKFERANAFLEKIISTSQQELDSREVVDLLENGFSDGGYFEMSVNVIKKYGVVPSYVMPDNFNVSNSYVLNKLINIVLKKGAIQLRKTYDEEDINKIKTETLSNVFYLLTLIYGEPPKKFNLEFFGKNNKKAKVLNVIKNVTPLEMYKKTKVNLDDFITLIHVPLKQYKYNQMYELEHSAHIYEKGNMRFLNVDRQTLDLAINAMIEYKQPIWFACDVGHYFDLENGIWDINMFDYESLFDVNFNHDISDLLEYKHFSPNHAMTLVGCHSDEKEYKQFVKSKLSKTKKYDLNLLKELWSDNKIKALKIENSWGSKYGSKGHFIITEEWRKKYLTEVVVSKELLKKFIKEHKAIDNKSFAKFKFKNASTKNKKEEIIYEELFGKGLKTKPIKVEHWSVFFNEVNK